MLRLVVSTVVFLACLYLLGRWADESDLPKGMTRNISIFVVALALANGVAWLVDRLV
jgi:hypothetical protein